MNIDRAPKPYHWNTTTDAELLATADPARCQNRALQVAHDRLCLMPSELSYTEVGLPSWLYRTLWFAYEAAGGESLPRDAGIDLDNWQRHSVMGLRQEGRQDVPLL